MPLFPKISDEQLEALQLKEPTAFRVQFRTSGDLVMRKPRRAEYRRFQDAVRKGSGDVEFIISQCLLAPTIAEWEAAIEQEACALPTRVLDILMKSVCMDEEYDVGK
jgi:hypothetical protein